MKLFTFKRPNTTKRVVSAEYDYSRLLGAAEALLFRETTLKIAQMIADDIRPYVLKHLDKEVIVKEVSLKVSEEVLAKIFSTGKSNGDKL